MMPRNELYKLLTNKEEIATEAELKVNLSNTGPGLSRSTRTVLYKDKIYY